MGGGAGLSAAAAPGYAFALGAALVWALYSVLARRFQGVPTDTVAGFCAVTAVLAAAAHFTVEATIWPDAGALAAAVALGIGPTGAAFFLWDIGMKRGDPRLLGTLAYVTPVASTLLLCAAGFAPLTGVTLAAAALVAAGGLVAARA
nr:EamA family transporter [Limobrevibacterium gyesilva]